MLLIVDLLHELILSMILVEEYETCLVLALVLVVAEHLKLLRDLVCFIVAKGVVTDLPPSVCELSIDLERI